MIIVYVDMVGDLFHYGHVNALKQCKEMGDYLIVGVHSDKVVNSYKRTPVMNMEQRINVIKSCKYVDQVIDGAPLIITNEYLEKYKIDIVCITDTRPIDQTEQFYKIPMELGIIKTFKHTQEISTTNIIDNIKYRIINNTL
tara:strand:+ start:988 stop:1410 length:423 start_codon:yes stop_codon:yes gene_type:complete